MMQQILQTQRGLSVISLLIAMAIGVFLVGGVVTIYVNSSASFRSRNIVSEVTETQRFALDDMRRIVVMAGRDINASEEQSQALRTFPPIGANGIVDSGAGLADEIAIRYRRGPGCGAYLNFPEDQPPAVVRFFLNGTQLMCSVDGAASVLATNVVALKVRYGVDQNDNGFPDRYLPALAVDQLPPPQGSNSPWSRVRAIQIGIVVMSADTLHRDDVVATAELPPIPPTVLPSTPQLPAIFYPWPADARNRLYKASNITVNLRNFNQIMTTN